MKNLILFLLLTLMPLTALAQETKDHYPNNPSPVCTSVDECLSLAEQGDVKAQHAMTLMYYNGDGVQKNYKEAAKWSHKAAKQNFSEAQYTLGTLYYHGDGVQQDTTEALKWYKKAAEQGEVRAQFNLGYIYENGDGVEQSHREAAKWYGQAAAQGHPKSQFILAVLHHKGEGMPQNHQEAAQWYRKAAEQGDIDAQYNIAQMSYKGDGIQKNYEEAAKWYRKIAESGDSYGQYTIGHMYSKGKGVEQSYENAAEWYRKAAIQGFRTAQFNLGVLYYNGQGVPVDYEEAYAWFNAAAEQGSEKAAETRDITTEELSPEALEQARQLATEYRKKYVEPYQNANAQETKGSQDTQKLQHYTNMVFVDPEDALTGLEKIQSPSSKLFQAYLYRFEKTDLEDSPKITNQLMNDAIALLSADINDFPYPVIDTSKTYEYSSNELFFRHMREILEIDSAVNLPVDFFKRHGRVALEEFGVKWGSQMDNFSPAIDIKEDLEKLTHLSAFRQVLDGAASCRAGTARYGRYRETDIAFADMLYETKLFPEPDECYGASCGTDWGINRYMKFWAGWGQWNHDYYDQLETLEIAAQEELINYYKESFAINNAEERAHNALQHVTDVYLGHYTRAFKSVLSHALIDKIHDNTYRKNDIQSFLEETSKSTNDPDAQALQSYARVVILNLLILNEADVDLISLVSESVDISFTEGVANFDQPILIAVSQPDILDVLLAAGADTNTRNGFGKTPLHAAVQQSNKESVEILLEAGAHIDLPTYKEDKIKMLTWDCGYYSGLQAYERTPLMYAAWQSTLPVIELLVRKGADKSIQDSNGDTALKYLEKNEALSSEDRKKARELLSDT